MVDQRIITSLIEKLADTMDKESAQAFVSELLRANMRVDAESVKNLSSFELVEAFVHITNEMDRRTKWNAKKHEAVVNWNATLKTAPDKLQ